MERTNYLDPFIHGYRIFVFESSKNSYILFCNHAKTYWKYLEEVRGFQNFDEAQTKLNELATQHHWKIDTRKL